MAMLEYGLDRTNELLRRSLIEHNYNKVELENQIIDEAIAYFDRTADREAVRTAMKDRFAVGIVRQSNLDENDDSTGYETYRKGLVGKQIDQGLIEAVTSGIGGKITSALANLFTTENQNWEFLRDEEPSDDAEAFLEAHRKAGGLSTALVDTDFLSCAINGAFLFVDWIGGHLKYHVVVPSCFYAIYHQTITDNGDERAVDYGEIEDATAIVIKMAGSLKAHPTEQQYLAIFGRSDEYPHGRMVTYRSNRWDAIPEIGMGEHEYEVGGEIANPLSYYAAQNPNEMVPEYPIIAMDGGVVRTASGIVTTTTSLYENCLEIDIAYSRLLKDALNAARGKDILTNEFNAPLPRSLEGVVSLNKGQGLTIDGRDASNAQNALAVLEGLVVSVGSGYNVPDYMLVSDPATLSASSGVALHIRTQGLINFRDYRIEVNRPQIQRLFEIEKSLLHAYIPEQAGVLTDVDQSWDAGTITIPEDEEAKTRRIEAARKAGFVDYVRAVKEFHNLATDAEAMALIDKFNERKTEYPGPQAEQPKRGAMPVGLTRQQG